MKNHQNFFCLPSSKFWFMLSKTVAFDCVVGQGKKFNDCRESTHFTGLRNFWLFWEKVMIKSGNQWTEWNKTCWKLRHLNFQKTDFQNSEKFAFKITFSSLHPFSPAHSYKYFQTFRTLNSMMIPQKMDTDFDTIKIWEMS